MPTIAENIARVRANIATAAKASGRNPEDICLLAATKQQPVDIISEAMNAGIDAAGENRVQEMLEKFPVYRDVPLHFIGRLQRNKVSKVVGRVSLIHSVDSIELCAEIDKCAKTLGIVQDILLQINVSGETSKGGFPLEKGSIPLDEIANFTGLSVRGLMCIPAPEASPEASKKTLLKMKHIFVDISSTFCYSKYGRSPFDILSMGMSNDYEPAVECGSTLVRVGSAIFGGRS